MAYDSFTSKYADHKSRIEALLLLSSPDPKSVSLWSLEPGKLYTEDEIFNNTLSFSGMSYKDFPLTEAGLLCYYHGHRSNNVKGSLESLGAISKGKLSLENLTKLDRYPVYNKTGLGADFGDPIAASSTWLVNELENRNKEFNKSTYRIVGSEKITMNRKSKRANLLYETLELLANNPEARFSPREIHHEIKKDNAGELSSDSIRKNLSEILDKLGRNKMIEYVSPLRELNGKRQSGWSRYRSCDKIDIDDAFAKVSQKYSSFNKEALKRTINFANKNIGEYFSWQDLSKYTGGIDRPTTNRGIEYLYGTGYLEHEFGKKSWAYAKANEMTSLMWEEFLEPIGRAAENMNKNITGFQDKLEIYKDNNKRIKAVRNRLEIYASEKSRIGPIGGKIVRKAIVEILRESEGKVKLSILEEIVCKKLDRNLHKNAIVANLKRMKDDGIVYRDSGYYGLVEDLKNDYLQ
ncbi:MAG TPA: hypothetical protein VJH34_02705 [archaeon]|nr:hypothetical protein [archaeon]